MEHLVPDIFPYTPEALDRLGDLLAIGGEDAELTAYASNTGFCFYKDDIIVGAGFLVCTNTLTCLAECFAIDPTLNKEEREYVASNLIKAVVALGHRHGYKYMVAEPKYKKSARRLEELGFNLTGSGKYLIRLN